MTFLHLVTRNIPTRKLIQTLTALHEIFPDAEIRTRDGSIEFCEPSTSMQVLRTSPLAWPSDS